MKYKIIVDKQSRENPSTEKREYEIDIEELRSKGNVADSLIITKDEDYVMRRLSINEYNVLKVLDEPIKEPLEEINIKLFEGDNYIYLFESMGNKFYAEYLVKNDFTDMYVTVNQMNSAINQTAEKIEINVSQKLDKDELGTQLILNKDALKMAWNQISQYLQLEGVEGKASLVIYDKNNKKLTTYNDTGQHFYDGNSNVFGEMGIKTIDEEKYISFSVLGEYDKAISDGMAWGVTTESDNKFWPLLFIKNFYIPHKNSDFFSGELVLGACDLVLDGMGTGIISGGIKIYGDPGGLYFYDIINNNPILYVSPKSVVQDAEFSIFDRVHFYKNGGGSNSFRIGNDSCVLMTDEGYLSCESLYVENGISCSSVSCHGHIYCNNGVEPFSLEEKKKNIKKYNNSALREIKNTDIYYYNYKEDSEETKRRVGAIIGNDYNCSKEIIGTEGKGIDMYSMISIAYKAIQEQQEQIETLQKEVKKLKEVQNGKD